MFPLIAVLLLSVFVTCSINNETTGRRLHRLFNEKYPKLLDYAEWEALKVLKKEILKDICVHHSSIMKAGVRGEAEVKIHVRSHINYYDAESLLRIVRIDLLKCEVTFINSDNKVSGQSTFYLAEGSSANRTFKLIRIKKSFYLVGEIQSDMWPTWMSKQNRRLVEEEIEAEIMERLSEEIQEVYLRGIQEEKPRKKVKKGFHPQQVEKTMRELPKEIITNTSEIDDEIRKENLEKVRKASQRKEILREDHKHEVLEGSHEKSENKVQEKIPEVLEEEIQKEILEKVPEKTVYGEIQEERERGSKVDAQPNVKPDSKDHREETQKEIPEKIPEKTFHGEIPEERDRDSKIDVQQNVQPIFEHLQEKTNLEKIEEKKKKKRRKVPNFLKSLCRKPTVKN